MPQVTINPSTAHPEYLAHIETWNMIREFVVGEPTLNKAKHIPKLSGVSEAEQAAYVARSVYYNASGRTVQALTGLITRKDAVVDEVDDEMTDRHKLIFEGRASLDTAATNLASELLSHSRAAVVAESNGPGEPYLTLYTAENVVNWTDFEFKEGPGMRMVVLQETYLKEDETNPFEKKHTKRWRVYSVEPPEHDTESEEAGDEGPYFGDLDPNSDNLRVRVRVYEADEAANGGGRGFVMTERYELSGNGGKPLTRIPVWIVGAEGITPVPSKPAILDLVNVNKGHLRNSADLEHGLHFTALPTPWVSGSQTSSDSTLHIGSSTAWDLGDDGQAGMLEFQGAGLAAIADAMQRKEGLMAQLGARLLMSPKREAETAESVKLQQGGEKSVVAKVAQVAGEVLGVALRFLYEHWLGSAKPDLVVRLTEDYDLEGITPEMLTAMVAGWQENAYSWETLYHNLEKLEFFQEGRTKELELEALMDEQTNATVPSRREAVEEEEDDEPEDDEPEDDEPDVELEGE